MKPRIFAAPRHGEIVRAIMGEVANSTWAFGSRVTGKHKEFSDLDLCVKRDPALDSLALGELREKFQNSNLPFTVDLVNYDDLPDQFKADVDANGVLIGSACWSA